MRLLNTTLTNTAQGTGDRAAHHRLAHSTGRHTAGVRRVYILRKGHID